ncbi:MAG: LapA family protein [Natronosporangium sp.]
MSSSGRAPDGVGWGLFRIRRHPTSEVLIVFLLQNTGSVEVTFLWLHGSLPLAIALLIAAVGAALLTMMVGVARITQLRRRLRRSR